MPPPDALPISLGSPAPMGINPLEKLSDAPFSGPEKAAFSTAMIEASTPAGIPLDVLPEVPVDGGDAEGGKALPGLPPETALMDRLRSVPAVDPKLEEFAVGMGIDRGLVRLLLIETAPADLTSSDATVAEEPAADAASLEDYDATSILSPSIPLISTVMPPPAVVGHVAMADVDVEAGVSPDIVAPIVDEDLLSWRSRLASEVTPRGVAVNAVTLPTTPGTASAPAALPLAAAASISTAPPTDMLPIVDEHRSSWRARMTFRPTDPGVPEEVAARSVAQPPGLVPPAVTTLQAGTDGQSTPSTASRLGSRSRAISAALPALDSASVPPGIGGRSIRDLMLEVSAGRTDTVAERASATASVTMPSTMAMISLPGAADRLPTGMPAETVTAGEASRTLDVPDANLKFGDRVQAFADAVAQRVLGQIRDDNWSVRMQLSPADLGTMDIDLTLTGNAVTATVGVANGEVRALLESGLPRLRESLESAGLQLAGWAFNQSGSRAFSEPARRTPLQGDQRARKEEADPVIQAGVSRLTTGVKTGSGAIDLFV